MLMRAPNLGALVNPQGNIVHTQGYYPCPSSPGEYNSYTSVDSALWHPLQCLLYILSTLIMTTNNITLPTVRVYNRLECMLRIRMTDEEDQHYSQTAAPHYRLLGISLGTLR